MDNPERMLYLARRREALYRWLSTDSPRDPIPFDDPDSFDFMTALAGDYLPSSGWTDDELENIPDGVRYEIQDGNLFVSPQPTAWHQEVSWALKAALREQCPRDWWPVVEGEIRIYADDKIDQSRTPDVMIAPRSLIRRDAIRGWMRPAEVPIAIEVVSPGSRTADRATKVFVYASWGIPLYLRLELTPEVVLYEYRLDQQTKQYTRPIEHREVFATDDPFPIRLELSDDAWGPPESNLRS